MSYQYSDELPADVFTKYTKKLEVLGLESCPYKHPADSWKNDPAEWPDLEYPDIYNYLVHSPGVFTQEAMRNYRSLEAHRFFVSGWVQTVMHKNVGHHFLFRADVKPSWRVTESPHHPWVATTSDGVIVAAHCDCMAGLGESCSHIGALLFKIEAAVRMGYKRKACTDDLCKWNACFVENIKGAPIADIKFYTKEAKEKLQTTGRKPRKEPLPATEHEQAQLLELLAGAEDPRKIVGLSAFGGHAKHFVPTKTVPASPKLPPTLRTLYNIENVDLADKDLETLCDKTFTHIMDSVSPQQAEFVTQSTQAQASSLVWHNQRAGRITGSTAHQALRTSLENPAPSLIKKICIPHPAPIQAPALNWGRKHEATALSTYNEVVEDVHSKSCVTRAGFVISSPHPFLGASPDGFVDCSCCGQGIVEVKCPYGHRDNTLQYAASHDKNFCLKTDLELKKDHEYYAQVQMQMMVTDVEYADFVVWTQKSCHVQRIDRDHAFIAEMQNRLTIFWKKCILPELLTRKLENSPTDRAMTVSQPSTCTNVNSDPSVKYCICHSTDGSGQMVACDSCNEWFHLKCLKMKRLPNSRTWYCPSCRKQKNKKRSK